MHLYFISGLGADERVFERLQLPPHVQVHHIHWLEPYPNESLQAYCLRLSEQIGQRENIVLAGLSFGGIVCIELNKIVHPRKIILFSSITTGKERPLLFRFINALQLHRVVPAALLKFPNPFTYWWFGVRTAREKYLLRNFLKNVSPHYLKWSMNAVLNWNNQQRPGNVVQIHGTADHIFPYKRTKADVLLKGAGHFMVHDQAETISRYLSALLTEESLNTKRLSRGGRT